MSPNKDIRSRKVVFIPFCLICQGVQAQGIVKEYAAVIKPVVQELLKHDVNLIQMPCPESQFGGYEIGLDRVPKGRTSYDTPEFRQLCEKLGSQVTQMIQALRAKNFEIIAILGVEYSPSCAINYQFEGRTVHQKGLFTEVLQKQLEQEGISIPFVGVNRRGTGPAIEELRQLLNTQLTLDLSFE